MFGTLKDTISLPNGVTIGRTTVGAVMVEDKDGKRRVLDDMDAAEWLFYSVKGEFPASPVSPPTRRHRNAPDRPRQPSKPARFATSRSHRTPRAT